MKISKVKIESVSPDPNNARKHSVKNLDSIKGSLRKFGQQKPIVGDEKGIILAGNGTREAALELGWTHIHIVRTTLKGWEAAAYAVADNRTSELAEWDDEQLKTVLTGLEELDDLDLSDIGFSDDDLDELLGEDRRMSEQDKADRDAREDVVPDIPKDENPYGVKRGDLWLLGAYLQCDECDKEFEYVAEKVDQKCEACHA